MEGKIITCCGDCVHYDWKKHKCRNGYNDNTNPRKHFYSDCKTLEDLEEHDKQVREDAINELLDAIKKSIISIEVRDRGSDYSTIYNWIEMIAERVKEQK